MAIPVSVSSDRVPGIGPDIDGSEVGGRPLDGAMADGPIDGHEGTGNGVRRRRGSRYRGGVVAVLIGHLQPRLRTPQALDNLLQGA